MPTIWYRIPAGPGTAASSCTSTSGLAAPRGIEVNNHRFSATGRRHGTIGSAQHERIGISSGTIVSINLNASVSCVRDHYDRCARSPVVYDKLAASWTAGLQLDGLGDSWHGVEDEKIRCTIPVQIGIALVKPNVNAPTGRRVIGVGSDIQAIDIVRTYAWCLCQIVTENVQELNPEHVNPPGTVHRGP